LAYVIDRDAEVVVTPGNPGIPGSTARPPEEIEADLFVIGPEVPLVDGLADRLRQAGKSVFGPGVDGARLEASKAWMKDLLVSAGVPTAGHGEFSDPREALAFLDTLGDLFVVKTDGLAAGKGVVVTDDRGIAAEAIGEYLSGAAFGEAGRRLVIEEGLTGPELSVFAVSNGRDLTVLPAARDHKRIGDGDTGPNTGGMGAYSPVPDVPGDLIGEVIEQHLEPTLAELRRRGVDYRGVLYAGLMLTPAGPKMLEYNVRFGGPETQVVMPRITSDVASMLAAAAAGEPMDEVVLDPQAAVTVVCASEGYPVAPRTGDPIKGIEAARACEGVTVFCAGVAEGSEGLVTAGGRVLNVTGQGPDVAAARSRAMAGVAELEWPGMTVRNDIALHA